MSSLIHVPNAEIDRVLTEVRRVMAPGALFGVGTWAGADDVGEWTELDEPYRFFSIRPDAVIQDILGRHFTIERFATIPVEEATHYQWTVARMESA
jgi:hypothetical protein